MNTQMIQTIHWKYKKWLKEIDKSNDEWLEYIAKVTMVEVMNKPLHCV